MSHIDPPSGFLLRALQAEKERPAPPSSVRDRVLMRVVASATLGVGAAAAAEAAAEGAQAASDQVAAGVGVTRLLSAKIAALVVASFAGGTATGAVLHAAVTSPAVEAPAPHPSSEVPSVLVAPVPSASSAIPAPSSAPTGSMQRPLPARPAASASGASSDLDLSTEQAIIERARTALMRGNAAEALDTLALHARSYPRGRLSQEREVLTIHALVGLGRRAEAQERAQRFRRSYPKSPLLAAIDAVLPPSPPASSSP